MTIKVRIGDQERDFNAVTESWISEQLRRRRQDGQTVCLQVLINTGSLNLSLPLLAVGAAAVAEAGHQTTESKASLSFGRSVD